MGSCCCEFGSDIVYAKAWVDYVLGCDNTGSGLDANLVGNRFDILTPFPSSPTVYTNRPRVTCSGADYRFYAPLGVGTINSGASPNPPNFNDGPIARYKRDFTLDLVVPVPVSGNIDGGATAVDVDNEGNMYATEGHHYVFKFDKDGNVEWETYVEHPDFPEPIPDSGATYYINDISVDKNGNVACVGSLSTNPFFDNHRHWVFLLDSAGSTVWQVMGEGGPFRDDQDNVRGWKCCFDADGNVFVGFRPNDSIGGAIADTDFRFVAGYAASDGTEMWMKTKAWVSATTKIQFAGAIAISPGGSQLCVMGWKNDRTGGNGYFSWADVYSGGPNFSTLDFTDNQIGDSTGLSSVTGPEQCFCAYETDGTLWAGLGYTGTNGSRIHFYQPDGTEIGNYQVPGHCGADLCLVPGTHPVFI